MSPWCMEDVNSSENDAGISVCVQAAQYGR